MGLAGPPAEQTFGHEVSNSRKSATSIDMRRAGSVMLGACIALEQSSPVNETHLITPQIGRVTGSANEVIVSTGA